MVSKNFHLSLKQWCNTTSSDPNQSPSPAQRQNPESKIGGIWNPTFFALESGIRESQGSRIQTHGYNRGNPESATSLESGIHREESKIQVWKSDIQGGGIQIPITGIWNANPNTFQIISHAANCRLNLIIS
jgi:hypothetical protein